MLPSRKILGVASVFLFGFSLFERANISPPRLRPRRVDDHIPNDGLRKLFVPIYKSSPNRGTAADIQEQNAYLDSIRNKRYIKPRIPLYGLRDDRKQNAMVDGNRIPKGKLRGGIDGRYRPVRAGVHDRSGHIAEGFRR